jgi:hypothetical protein
VVVKLRPSVDPPMYCESLTRPILYSMLCATSSARSSRRLV